MFLGFASLVAAVIPVFAYLLIIWYLDRYEREPFWLVLLNFFWGATGAIFLGILGSVLFQLPLDQLIQIVADDNTSEMMSNLSGAIITAPLVEEFTKGIFLVLMSFSKKFDSGLDGAVYGGAIGLGFGMTENFMYFIFEKSTSAWLLLVIIRTLFSAVMHCLSTATFGAFLGYSKFKPLIFKIILIPTGFFLAVFLHFGWNFSVSFKETTIFGFLFLILYLFVMFSIFQISVYLEGKTILRELQEESNAGLIPPEHLNHIPFVSRRFKYGWCPNGVDQRSYVKTATILALRKNQSRNTSGNLKQSYLKDIENLRHKIQMMFYDASSKIL